MPPHRGAARAVRTALRCQGALLASPRLDASPLAVRTGMRRGESMALHGREVDFERRRITVRCASFFRGLRENEERLAAQNRQYMLKPSTQLQRTTRARGFGL